MNPGRELDAIMAEKVMGWKRVSDREYFGQAHCSDVKGRWVDPQCPGMLSYRTEDEEICCDCGTEEEGWSPSKNIKHAWEVVGRMSLLGYWLDFDNSDRNWHAEFQKRNETETHLGCSDTAPHAICLAALEALKVTIGN